MTNEQAILDEAPFRFENLRTKVHEHPHGIDIEFVCCGHVEHFGIHGDPNLIGQTITDHITKECPEPARLLDWSGNAQAKTPADEATGHQVVTMRALARVAGLDADVLCLEQLRCKPERLSRRAADAAIAYLKGARHEQ